MYSPPTPYIVNLATTYKSTFLATVGQNALGASLGTLWGHK